MSKELIISANRHETRVAVLEDDQVVELFHQRENEYSLAGSIHKGKVTRVLPGMQSAFVDIGLERDAFLYVSDFFEDNDEYDKIVTSVEDRVFKQQTGPAPAPQSDAPIEAAPPAEEAASAPAVAPVQAPPVSSAAPLEERRDDRGGRDRDRDDRRGRGRRRGRGGRGGSGGPRGLPDSKFYSPRGDAEPRYERRPESRDVREPRPESAPPSATPSATSAAPPAAESPAQGDDFLVLPGEKLSKYRHGAAIFDEPESSEPPESEPLATEPEPDGIAEPAPEIAAAPELRTAPEPQATPESVPEPEAPREAGQARRCGACRSGGGSLGRCRRRRR